MQLPKRIFKKMQTLGSRTELGKYPPFSFYNDLIRFYIRLSNKRRFKKVYFKNNKFWIDTKRLGVLQLNLWMGKAYEKKTTCLIKKILNPADVTVDVGAHIGYYTVLFSNLANKGEVFAFEPEPSNFRLLRLNANLPNVTLEKKAVSNEDKKVKLDLNNCSIVTKKRLHNTVVEAVSLDSYFLTQNFNPDLVKIDVEGGEPLVLEGMESILNTAKPDIIMEINHLEKTGFEIKKIFNNLVNFDYKFYGIGKSGNLSRLTTDEVIKLAGKNSLNLSRNLFCTTIKDFEKP